MNIMYIISKGRRRKMWDKYKKKTKYDKLLHWRLERLHIISVSIIRASSIIHTYFRNDFQIVTYRIKQREITLEKLYPHIMEWSITMDVTGICLFLFNSSSMPYNSNNNNKNREKMGKRENNQFYATIHTFTWESQHTNWFHLLMLIMIIIMMMEIISLDACDHFRSWKTTLVECMNSAIWVISSMVHGIFVISSTK